MASLAVAPLIKPIHRKSSSFAEGIDFAAGAKTPIVDAYENSNSGVAPANRVATGMTTLATDTRGSYVSSVAIERWKNRRITFGGPLAHQDLHWGRQFH